MEPQGSAARALDPGPSALTLPPVGGGGVLTGATGDTAHLIVLIEVEVAYTPCRMALGAAKPQLSPRAHWPFVLVMEVRLASLALGKLKNRPARRIDEVLPGGEPGAASKLHDS